MKQNAINLGVVGLGRAFTLMLPTFLQDPRIRLVAGTDPRPEACAQLESQLGAKAWPDIESLCTDPAVEAVYIATPHQLHAEHIALVASAGKPILVEKPLAITLEECNQIIEAIEKAGVNLIVGHSHSFNAPVLRATQLLQSGRYGPVGMIHAFNYTDFLYRPRRPEELDTRKGGGVVFNQGAHQVDIVRLLGGGLVRSVRACTGNWDPERPTEGAYSALLCFEEGAFASLTYSGYAHFDSDELLDNIGEMGFRKDSSSYGRRRAALAGLAADAEAEARLKAEANFGGKHYQPGQLDSPAFHQHFGHCVVSAAKADLRLTPAGLTCYESQQKVLSSIPVSTVPRVEVIDELWGALRHGIAPLHSAQWARATMEVCLAILESARSGAEVSLQYQVATPPLGPLGL